MLSPEEPSGNSPGCSQVKRGPGQTPPKERSQVRDHRPQARLRSVTVLGGSGSRSRAHGPVCGPSLSAGNHVTVMDRTPPRPPAMSWVPAKVARPRGAVRSPWGPNQHVLTACPPTPWCSDPGSQNPSCPPLPPPAPHPDSSQRPPPGPPPAAWDTPFSPALGPHLTTPALGRSAPSRHGTASSSRGPHPQEPPQPRAHITH